MLLFSDWFKQRINTQTLGPFIREKYVVAYIVRGLHKTRTARINGTKIMLASNTGRGLYKAWHIQD